MAICSARVALSHSSTTAERADRTTTVSTSLASIEHVALRFHLLAHGTFRNSSLSEMRPILLRSGDWATRRLCHVIFDVVPLARQIQRIGLRTAGSAADAQTRTLPSRNTYWLLIAEHAPRTKRRVSCNCGSLLVDVRAGTLAACAVLHRRQRPQPSSRFT